MCLKPINIFLPQGPGKYLYKFISQSAISFSQIMFLEDWAKVQWWLSKHVIKSDGYSYIVHLPRPTVHLSKQYQWIQFKFTGWPQLFLSKSSLLISEPEPNQRGSEKHEDESSGGEDLVQMSSRSQEVTHKIWMQRPCTNI